MLSLLMLLVGCDQLRVQNLPNSKLFCDVNLVGIWQFDDDDGNKSFLFLDQGCNALYALDIGTTIEEDHSVEFQGREIRSFNLDGKNFLVSPRDPERDPSNAFDNGYFLLRYKLQSEALLIAPGDVYSAVTDIDSGKIPGRVQRSKNSDGSSIVALITGTSEEIEQQLQSQNYYAKFREPRLHRANAMDAARVMQLVTEFQATQSSKN